MSLISTEPIEAPIGPQLDEISGSNLFIEELPPESLNLTSRSDYYSRISGESSGLGTSLASSRSPSSVDIYSDHTHDKSRSNSTLSFSCSEWEEDREPPFSALGIDEEIALLEKSASLNGTPSSKEAKFGSNDDVTSMLNERIAHIEFETTFLKKEFEELRKILGRLETRIAQQNERIIRLEKKEDFGYDFLNQAKITCLEQAVQHYLKIGNISEDRCVKTLCTIIMKKLGPSNDENNSEFVTGIQKDILIWYLGRLRGLENNEEKKRELEKILEKYPWVGEEGKLSLVNVRLCIHLVPKTYRQTLAFLAQTINWKDLDSFIAPRTKLDKTKGHGLYFLMHHLYSNSHSEANRATTHSLHSICPFPPPGEIEIDAQGTITTEGGITKIQMGEMKTSENQSSYAKEQLKLLLVFFAGLHKLLAVNDSPTCYDLVGYVFISGNKKASKPEVFELPPYGKITYVTFNS